MLESKFLRAAEQAGVDREAKEQAEAAAQEAQELADARADMLAHADRTRGEDDRLVHAWVLVKSGLRGVKETVFVEPTTGRKYPPALSPYLGIEFAWNHANYWICMQHAEPHSDCRCHPAKVCELSLEL